MSLLAVAGQSYSDGAAAARLILVRHAEIDCSDNGSVLLCGSHDACLSDRGWTQVEALRRRLRNQTFEALYSSPLRRAVDTAGAAPEYLLSHMRLVPELAEIHCGEVEGLPIHEIKTSRPEQWTRNENQQDESFAWPGGETYRDFRNRVLRAIRSIAAGHSGRSVLVVTHAGVVNQILGSIAGQSAARWENFRPGNTAVTEVLWTGDSGRLVSFDDRSHLE